MIAPPTEATDVQVETEHYRPTHYDELHRWVSYWYQIQSVARAQPETLLEIGVGSGVLSNYLRNRMSVNVTTFDFDPSLEPDLVGDVRQLDDQVSTTRFDTVVAFQVLEHLPFEDFPTALRQMEKASRKNVIISLPYYGYPVQMRLRLWKLQLAFGLKVSKFPKWAFDGEHHWEIGTRGHSLSTVKKEISKVLKVDRHYFCKDYPYHYFFECSKTERA